MVVIARPDPKLVALIAAQNVLARKRYFERARSSLTKETLDLEASFQGWLPMMLPNYFRDAFADHHQVFWPWLWALTPGVRPTPFIGIWPRGGAKSTSAEAACVVVGARRQRRYILYVSETQDQANQHVQNIGAMLAAPSIAHHYPDLASRAVNQYGTSKGWRRDRLWTESGLTIDALGLDSRVRGLRIEDQRPDMIILDDIDKSTDGPHITNTKIKKITSNILPAGSPDVAVLGIQNLVHGDSMFARLASGKADFLTDRLLSGPIPAVEDLTYQEALDDNGRRYFQITGGLPTWDGQDLTICQQNIRSWGLTVFLEEAQHDVTDPPGGLFDHISFVHCDPEEVPDLIRTTVWVDPAVTSTKDSDSHGIQVDGLGQDGQIYRLWSFEQVITPRESIEMAIRMAVRYQSPTVGVETDQGGDTWEEIYLSVVDSLWKDGFFLLNPDDLPALQAYLRALTYLDQGLPNARGEFLTWDDLPAKPEEHPIPSFTSQKAGAGHGPKVHRASQMLVDYENGRIVHVRGTHATLERALRRFPKKEPLDLVDASYWAWYDLSRAPGTSARADAPRSLAQAWGRAGVTQHRTTDRYASPGEGLSSPGVSTHLGK